MLIQPKSSNYRSIDFIIVDFQKKLFFGIQVSASEDAGHFWSCLNYESNIKGVSNADFKNLWINILQCRQSEKDSGISSQHQMNLNNYHKCTKKINDFRHFIDSQSWSFFFIYFCPRHVMDKIIASKRQRRMTKPIGIKQDAGETSTQGRGRPLVRGSGRLSLRGSERPSVQGKRKMPEPEEVVEDSPLEGKKKLIVPETGEDSSTEGEMKIADFKELEELESPTLIWDASFLASFEENVCYYDFLKRLLPSHGQTVTEE